MIIIQLLLSGGSIQLKPFLPINIQICKFIYMSMYAQFSTLPCNSKPSGTLRVLHLPRAEG